jgi:glycosyltransferase involved in cell wall biosynthesis
MQRIDVIIPAYNEEDSIAKVIREIPKELVREIVVIDNNSNDDTARNAKQENVTVLHESKLGYGYACLKGINYLSNKERQPDIVVFLDGDYSDYPEEMPIVVQPIIKGNVEMVIGSRALGKREKGAMTPQQIFGNWLATRLMSLFYGVKYTDLGPFRAIRFDKLIDLNMQDKTYGWTIEMQLKAAKAKMKSTEVAVNYRKRIGFSKVSGTVKGTVFAGVKIITAIFKYL